MPRVSRHTSSRPSDNPAPSGLLKKGPWSSEEDALLLAFVDQHGASAWNMARCYFPGLRRTGKSCRLRYLNQLRPGIRRTSVSPQEERLILQLYAVYGPQWSRIASLLNGRTDNNVKNVVNMRLKRARRRAASLNFARAAARVLFNPVDGFGSQLNLQDSESISTTSSPPTCIVPAISHYQESKALSLPSFSCSSLELPSVQVQARFQYMASNNSLGPDSGLKLPSVQIFTTHPISSGNDMMAASSSFFPCFNNHQAGDKDLLEAVYASSYASADSNSVSSSSMSSSSSCSYEQMIDDSSLNAILRSAGARLPSLHNQEMENSYESDMQPAGGSSEGLSNLCGELTSLIVGSMWDSMPQACHIDDLAFE